MDYLFLPEIASNIISFMNIHERKVEKKDNDLQDIFSFLSVNKYSRKLLSLKEISSKNLLKTILIRICSKKQKIFSIETIKKLLDENCPSYLLSELTSLTINSEQFEITKLLVEKFKDNPFLCEEVMNNVIRKNKITAAKELLSLDINVNRNKLLYDACSNNNIEIVKLLLETKKISSSYGKYSTDNPIYIACLKEYNEIAELLLNDGQIKPNVSCLAPLCFSGNYKLVKLITSKEKTFLDSKNKHTKSYFEGACRSGNLELTKLLFSYVKDSVAKFTQTEFNILLVNICVGKNIKIAKMIFPKVNNINKLIDKNNIAFCLNIICKFTTPDFFKFIIENYYSMSAEDYLNAAMKSFEYKNFEMLLFILKDEKKKVEKKKFQSFITKSMKYKILSSSSLNDSMEITKFLLEDLSKNK